MSCNYHQRYSAINDPNYVMPNINGNVATNNNLLPPAGTDNPDISSIAWPSETADVFVEQTDPYGMQQYEGDASSISYIPVSDTFDAFTETTGIPDYLMRHIGRLMRVEFFIGNSTIDRTGYLRSVGADFIELESMDMSNCMMCDLSSIRFVTLLNAPTTPETASFYENR